VRPHLTRLGRANRLITKLEMGELTSEKFHSARMLEVQSFHTEEETTTYNSGDFTVTLKEWEVELTGNKLGHLVGFRIPKEERR
jgi:hypothetical protein